MTEPKYRFFQFNLYADSCHIQGNRIIFKNVVKNYVLFEILLLRRDKNLPYFTDKVKLKSLINLWKSYFPLQGPTSFLNGFKNCDRYLLPFVLDNPILCKNDLSFTFRDDTFKTNININNEILLWNKKGSLHDISLTIGVSGNVLSPIAPPTPFEPFAYEFNMYSDEVYFEGTKIVFKNILPQSISFQINTQALSPLSNYTADILNTQDVLGSENWKKFFPFNNPNAYINGFKGEERRILTLKLRNPVYENKVVKFDYQLDIDAGNLDLNCRIKKWNRKGKLRDVSLFIDPTETITLGSCGFTDSGDSAGPGAAGSFGINNYNGNDDTVINYGGAGAWLGIFNGTTYSWPIQNVFGERCVCFCIGKESFDQLYYFTDNTNTYINNTTSSLVGAVEVNSIANGLQFLYPTFSTNGYVVNPSGTSVNVDSES